jgi:hypothetical protein
MKSPKVSNGAPAPAQVNFDDLESIRLDPMNGMFGRDYVRFIMTKHPMAPRPVRGGFAGSKAIWRRADVLEFINYLNEHGWPKNFREVA